MYMKESRLLQFDSPSWPAQFQYANWLLRRQAAVYLVIRPLDGRGSDLPPGSLVTPEPTPDEHELLAAHAEKMGVRLAGVDRATPVELRPLTEIVVALYGGGGSPFNHASVLGSSGFRLRFLSDAEIRAGALEWVDVLIMPGGGFRAMQGQLDPLGHEGTRAIAAWVRRGGMYIGSCAGAFDCAIASESFTRTCSPKADLQLVNARVWNEGSGELEGLHSPGVGAVVVKNVHPNHPVMFGMPETFSIVHYNGPVFEPLDSPQIDGASLAIELACFVGAGAAFTPAEAFMGASTKAGTTVLERAVAAERASIVAGELGVGRVVAFGSHPEFGFDLAMREWGLPGRMLVNAVMWQAANGGYPRRQGMGANDGVVPVSYPATAKYEAIAWAAGNLREVATRLRARSVEPEPEWLSREYAMAFFGENPVCIWTQSLDAILTMSDEIAELASDLRTTMADLPRLDPGESALDDLETYANALILSRREPSWQQDGGFEGVLALLDIAQARCARALERWEMPLGPPAGAYSYFHENPYHLVVGSYLAAVGCTAGAWHLLTALEAEIALTSGTVLGDGAMPAGARLADGVSSTVAGHGR
jgi:hypothetical protein